MSENAYVLKEIERYRIALIIIARTGCEHWTEGSCKDHENLIRTSRYTSDQWCFPCVAAEALESENEK